MDCGIPYLPHRLPGEQPDPGLERPRLSRRLGGGRAQPALDQQFPGGHRPRLPGAVRGVLHAQHRRQPGHHQDHRMRDRRPRHRQRLDQARAAVGRRPARRSRSSARARPAWPARSSSRAPATTCMSSRRTPRPAACCATAFPTSRWRSGIVDMPRRADGRRRRDLPLRRPCRRQPAGREAARRLRRGRARRRRREAARPADPRPRARRHPFRHGLPAAAEPARQRRAAGRQSSRSSPAASTSSSSAAATPAPTASAPRSARARCR